MLNQIKMIGNKFKNMFRLKNRFELFFTDKYKALNNGNMWDLSYTINYLFDF